jgi:hypothetical protein
MDKNIQQLLQQYIQNFQIQSYYQGYSQTPPANTNSKLVSMNVTQNSNWQNFINTISLSAFDSETASAFIQLFTQANSSMASLYQTFDITDVRNLSLTQLQNLLSSFGFPTITVPSYVKANILTNLVANYKIKSTPLSVNNMLNLIANNSIKIVEMYFANDDPEFVGNTTIQLINYPNLSYSIVVPYSAAENDKYWQITYEQAQQWPYKYTMSPYYSIINVIDNTANLEALIRLRTSALSDYIYYLNHPTTFLQRQILNIEELPNQISYLELYFYPIFINMLQRNQTLLGQETKNYMYYDLSLQNYTNDFNTDFVNEYNPVNDIPSNTQYKILESVKVVQPIANITWIQGTVYKFPLSEIPLPPPANATGVLQQSLLDLTSYALTIAQLGLQIQGTQLQWVSIGPYSEHYYSSPVNICDQGTIYIMPSFNVVLCISIYQGQICLFCIQSYNGLFPLFGNRNLLDYLQSQNLVLTEQSSSELISLLEQTNLGISIMTGNIPQELSSILQIGKIVPLNSNGISTINFIFPSYNITLNLLVNTTQLSLSVNLEGLP